MLSNAATFFMEDAPHPKVSTTVGYTYHGPQDEKATRSYPRRDSSHRQADSSTHKTISKAIAD